MKTNFLKYKNTSFDQQIEVTGLERIYNRFLFTEDKISIRLKNFLLKKRFPFGNFYGTIYFYFPLNKIKTEELI